MSDRTNLCTLAFWFVTLVAAQSTAQVMMTGPSTQNQLLGTWVIEVHYADGGLASGTERWYAGPGGKSLIEEYQEKGSAGEIAGEGILWWDDKLRDYRLVWCESTNASGCIYPAGKVRWDAGQLIIEGEGFKEIFSDITDRSFKQTISGKGLKPLLTIEARKK